MIGTKFIKKSAKRKDIYTVVDILTTYNNAGNIVRVEYLAETVFCGQIVTATVSKATVDLNKI